MNNLEMLRFAIWYVILAEAFIGIGYIIMIILYKKDEKYRKQQRTYVYCPKCNNELVKNGNLIKDTDFVYYKCSKCGHESKWDFVAPCPILVEGDK